ncbi:MAG: TRAP transporter large permease subunit [Deltaproteobacteria bacterium]|nr:TRAP transporter large permease subunit [Deltaproteobacteria bacterium]
MGLLSSILTVFLALIGTPLFVVIAFSGMVFLFSNGIDLTAMIIELYKLAHTPTLVAIPLFSLAGYILAASKAPDRLVRLSNALLGWLPGGLAVIALGVSAVFTALTGATGLTIIALGGLLFPALIIQHYPEKFSLGLLTTSGTLGLLFPPSLPLILYGVVAQTSIDQLFLAGILPGLLIVLLLSLYSALKGYQARVERPKFTFPEVAGALWGSVWEIPLPFVVLGGIYTGFVAISEAAVLTVLYVLIVEVGIYRDIKIRELFPVILKSTILVGGILIILGVSFGLTNTLINEEIPMKILNFLKLHVQNHYTFLLWLNLFLLGAGCLLGTFPALIILVPLIVPVAQAYDLHPVHLGIILLTNLEIGASLPPLGINLFISSIRFERSVIELYRASIPFILILLLTLAVITYLPVISLFFL